jgi:hypothetical protein
LFPCNSWAADGDVRFDPTSSTIAVGGSLALDVLVDSAVEHVGGFLFAITYDSNIIQYDGIDVGPDGFNSTFEGLDATNFPLPGDENFVPGTVKVSGVDITPTEVGEIPKGNNLRVLTLNFTGLAQGTANISLTIEDLIAANENGDDIGAATPRAGGGSVVTVGGGGVLCGDANGDGEVNTGDALWIERVGVELPAPNFNAAAADVFGSDGANEGDALMIKRADVEFALPAEGMTCNLVITR